MNLARAATTIGGWTMLSRLAGFVRDMLMSRALGAGLAADAFFVAFKLPNLFRRLFAEGAFSAAFVPLYSRALEQGGHANARAFAEEVLSVFLPILLLFTALMQLCMPAVVWAMASGFSTEPGKIELATSLTRITFPYLMLISLASLLGGILNSQSKFVAAAAAPVLLNGCLIVGLLIPHQSDAAVAIGQSVAVTISGFVQFVWLALACHRNGVDLRLRVPRLTPRVGELGRIILPATFGAGIYQISQFIDTFFATRLPQGSMSYLNYADRLNQLPLGVIGIALGTAILPTLSRQIAADNAAAASTVQNRAMELSMLLTLPAAVALGVSGLPIVQAFYQGGRFTGADAQWTGWTLMALVAGLPAYVLLKVVTPGYFARSDTKTPVKIAAIALVVNVALNLALIGWMKIAGLALATALSSWLNFAILVGILIRRGHFRFDQRLKRRVWRLLLAALLMGGVLHLLQPWLVDMMHGHVLRRMAGCAALVTIGMAVYFSAAAALGGFQWSELRGRRAA